jgi:hypothetical protein
VRRHTLTPNTFGDHGQSDTPHADKTMHSRLETPGGSALDVFGMCTDRFGIPWLVSIGQAQG